MDSRRSSARLAQLLAGVFAALALIGTAAADTIVINSNTADPAPRAAFQAIVDRFRAENAGTDVVVNYYDPESYKIALRGWLTSVAPDVVLWNAGNRMRQLATLGLLADVSDLWTADRRAQFTPAAIDLVTLDGKQYGTPYTSYTVGLYVRRDMLSAAGITGPSDWAGLVAACDKLKAVGLEPFVIGTKDLWPAAGWFDYIDLRLNGIDFHNSVMAGTVPYTDPRIVAVFDRWQELIDHKCFTSNHVGLSWQEAQSLLYQGRGAMMLIGGFITPNFPPELRDKLDLITFPVIVAGVANDQEAPMNSAHVPARARNPDGGKRFLAFMMRSDVQEQFNGAMQTLPVNRAAGVGTDKFLGISRQILSSAAGLTQYFDRDTNDEFAAIAMRGFQEFMVAPDRRNRIIADVEQARQRVFGR